MCFPDRFTSGSVVSRSVHSTPSACALMVLLQLAVATAPGVAGDIVLKQGDSVPEFEARTGNGEVWRSSEHVGKKVIVIYFYPADLTSGCTRQACIYRDHMKQLEQEDVEVVGVSGDTEQNHQVFARINALNFPLIADMDGRVARAFGVPVRAGDSITRMVDGVEQTLTRGVTASRWTFIIGKDGKVLRKDTMVEPEKDCEKVLETVRRLTADSE